MVDLGGSSYLWFLKFRSLKLAKNRNKRELGLWKARELGAQYWNYADSGWINIKKDVTIRDTK